MSIMVESGKCHCAEIKPPSTMFIIHFGELPSSRMYTIKQPCSGTLYVSFWPEKSPLYTYTSHFQDIWHAQTEGRAAQLLPHNCTTTQIGLQHQCEFQFRNKNNRLKCYILMNISLWYFYIFALISFLNFLPLCIHPISSVANLKPRLRVNKSSAA